MRYRKLTLQTLKEKGACKNQINLFRATFGKSVNVTVELCESVASRFAWEWATRNLLSAPAWAAYQAARAPAGAAYEAATASAWAAYKAATASAGAAYQAARAPAGAAYEVARARAFAVAYITDTNQE